VLYSLNAGCDIVQLCRRYNVCCNQFSSILLSSSRTVWFRVLTYRYHLEQKDKNDPSIVVPMGSICYR
jgi:hypothetical protein